MSVSLFFLHNILIDVIDELKACVLSKYFALKAYQSMTPVTLECLYSVCNVIVIVVIVINVNGSYLLRQPLSINVTKFAMAENMVDLIDGYCRAEHATDESFIARPNKGKRGSGSPPL